jgi:hypothetical protein
MMTRRWSLREVACYSSCDDVRRIMEIRILIHSQQIHTFTQESSKITVFSVIRVQRQHHRSNQKVE